MRLGVVDVEHETLGVCAAQCFRTAQRSLPSAFRVRVLLGDHDQAVSKAKFAVLDPAVLALDLEPDLEAESAAQPINRRSGILVDHAAREAGPARGSGFHPKPPKIVVDEFGLTNMNSELGFTNMDNVNEHGED